jgi:hypothetical protein
MAIAGKFATAALCALLALEARAQAQNSGAACPTPITGPALAQQMRLLSWKETEYVVQRDPGMKKVYAVLPDNIRAQIQANPGAFPWDRVAGNRSQETLDRIAGLVHDARLQAAVDSIAPLDWPAARKVLAQDAQFQAWTAHPKGTPLEGAAANPRTFEWKALLGPRDTCQLTALLQLSARAGKAD